MCVRDRCAGTGLLLVRCNLSFSLRDFMLGYVGTFGDNGELIAGE